MPSVMSDLYKGLRQKGYSPGSHNWGFKNLPQGDDVLPWRSVLNNGIMVSRVGCLNDRESIALAVVGSEVCLPERNNFVLITDGERTDRNVEAPFGWSLRAATYCILVHRDVSGRCKIAMVYCWNNVDYESFMDKFDRVADLIGQDAPTAAETMA